MKLMPLTDAALASASGARGLRLRFAPGYFKKTVQRSDIENDVLVIGDGNSVSISNTVTQDA